MTVSRFVTVESEIRVRAEKVNIAQPEPPSHWWVMDMADSVLALLNTCTLISHKRLGSQGGRHRANNKVKKKAPRGRA